MAKLGSQSTEAARCYHIPTVVEHRQEEQFGIVQERGHQAGIRSVGAGRDGQLGNRGREGPRQVDPQRQNRRQRCEHAPHQPCVGSPPPSYEPSTPCEFL